MGRPDKSATGKTSTADDGMFMLSMEALKEGYCGGITAFCISKRDGKGTQMNQVKNPVKNHRNPAVGLIKY
ncbi:unnamed protein product [Toxocara canis]|uniref:Transposase n=1 Tax=Toxocara canis TaxID=6265 RepID=A0A183U2F5_TOXCA|nr:unnamed protein product [Toxocara canis]